MTMHHLVEMVLSAMAKGSWDRLEDLSESLGTQEGNGRVLTTADLEAPCRQDKFCCSE